jgi:hypothetical protein
MDKLLSVSASELAPFKIPFFALQPYKIEQFLFCGRLFKRFGVKAGLL